MYEDIQIHKYEVLTNCQTYYQEQRRRDQTISLNAVYPSNASAHESCSNKTESIGHKVETGLG